MKQIKNNRGIIIASIICLALVVISVVGGLVYMQKQNIAQREKEFQQQKQLKEYEQEQLNARNKADNIQKCQAAAMGSSSPFDGLSCNKE
jgi:hypothetical protein